ncbi:MAG TPA: response regulator [Polyangiaceae bacterium]|jgi:twitching motility two-component system response regulator PilH|nr:response regulator [Polyangiaceae bacterium]
MTVERHTILIADDEFASLEVLALLLTGAGFTVVTASDGEEALARLSENRIDLVITDYKMPKMDGSELCERMLQSPALAQIPVIFTSATYRQDVPRPANVRAFFGKPLLFKTLIEHVRQLLEPEQQG